ncbi:hypothetical protein RB195_018321 [Necator americanus]|uniref:Core domain-containing protein n=1 Tax=Necator americanus TaxID=51031 RepID=A0ABR1C969_NECAM
MNQLFLLVLALFTAGLTAVIMWRSCRITGYLNPIVSRNSFMSNAAVRPLTFEDIKVTDKAHQRLKEILSPGERLRVEVDGGGCSGFEYKIKVDTKLQEDDRLWKRDDVEVVIDDMSFGYLRGATIDYVEDLMKASFRVVNNPVADKGCSCGSSFAVKMD